MPDIARNDGLKYSNSLGFAGMNAKPQRVAHGQCRFCGRFGMTKEHIWNQWLQKIIPAAGDRIESLFSGRPTDLQDRSKYNFRKKQGAVQTLTTRTVCQICNGGWMKRIGEAAQPIAAKLIKGEAVELKVIEQQNLAIWIALSAIMLHIKTKSERKLPREDMRFMNQWKHPQARWFVGIGYYDGPKDAFACHYQDGDTEKLLAFQNQQVQLHSIATIMGRLFTYVAVPPIAPINPVPAIGSLAQLVSPYIKPIWPPFIPIIKFPPPWFERITGTFNPNGGHALSLSSSYLQNAGWVHSYW